MIGFWDHMLDLEHQTQPHTGLAKLLRKYDLAPHTTKEGEVAWCSQTFIVNEPLQPPVWEHLCRTDRSNGRLTPTTLLLCSITIKLELICACR